jgi:hypothetical protein
VPATAKLPVSFSLAPRNKHFKLVAHNVCSVWTEIHLQKSNLRVSELQHDNQAFLSNYEQKNSLKQAENKAVCVQAAWPEK